MSSRVVSGFIIGGPPGRQSQRPPAAQASAQAPARPVVDEPNVRGAIIFIIDVSGHVLCGNESNFESQDNRGNRFIYGDLTQINDPIYQNTLATRLHTFYQPTFALAGHNNVLIPPVFEESATGEQIIGRVLVGQLETDYLRAGGVQGNRRLYRTKPRIVNPDHVIPGHEVFGAPKGGRNDDGNGNFTETVVDCAIRELREEIGFVPQPGQLIRATAIGQGIRPNDYAVFYVRVDAQQRAAIIQTIQTRTINNIGEMFNLAFRDLSTLFQDPQLGPSMNPQTWNAREFLRGRDLRGNPRITFLLLGGKRRRTHKHRKSHTRRKSHKSHKRRRTHRR